MKIKRYRKNTKKRYRKNTKKRYRKNTKKRYRKNTKKRYNNFSKKSRKLQKGGANYTIRDYNAGRLPNSGDIFVGNNTPEIYGGVWQDEGLTNDRRYTKFRWYWYQEEPRCHDYIGRDTRLRCDYRGDNQTEKDEWCRRMGWDCARCANSGYCTHIPLHRHDEPEYDDEGWERVPDEVWEPEDADQAQARIRSELEQQVLSRPRGRLPCNPIPRTCDEVPVDDGNECLGGRCPLCEQNEDIVDPINLETIPPGKGVCIDRQCYNEDSLREALENELRLPHNRKLFSLDDLDNALQQNICNGEPRRTSNSGPSLSSNTGPSSASDSGSRLSSDDDIAELREQAEVIQAQLISLPPTDRLEEEIRGYQNVFRILEAEMYAFSEQYSGIIPNTEPIIKLKEANLAQIQQTIRGLQNQLDIQMKQKQELEDSLTAINLVLQENGVENNRGGKKNKKKTKKYNNKKIKTKKNKKNKKKSKKYNNKKIKTRKKYR